MELSGIHVGKIVKIKYRYPSYSKSRLDSEETMTITSLEHKRDGKVVIYHGSQRLTVPADATIDVAEFSGGIVSGSIVSSDNTYTFLADGLAMPAGVSASTAQYINNVNAVGNSNGGLYYR